MCYSFGKGGSIVKILTVCFLLCYLEEPIRLEQVNAELRFRNVEFTKLALILLPFSSRFFVLFPSHLFIDHELDLGQV